MGRAFEFRKERALKELDEDKKAFSAGKVKQIQMEIDWVKANAKAIEEILF